MFLVGTHLKPARDSCSVVLGEIIEFLGGAARSAALQTGVRLVVAHVDRKACDVKLGNVWCWNIEKIENSIRAYELCNEWW